MNTVCAQQGFEVKRSRLPVFRGMKIDQAHLESAWFDASTEGTVSTFQQERLLEGHSAVIDSDVFALPTSLWTWTPIL